MVLKHSQYNQGFMPQNQMYPNNFADQMAMYNNLLLTTIFQQMQYMQQQQPQQPGSATAPLKPLLQVNLHLNKLTTLLVVVK